MSIRSAVLRSKERASLWAYTEDTRNARALTLVLRGI